MVNVTRGLYKNGVMTFTEENMDDWIKTVDELERSIWMMTDRIRMKYKHDKFMKSMGSLYLRAALNKIISIEKYKLAKEYYKNHWTHYCY